MAAPIGNRFWEARSTHGAKPKFENGIDLYSACCEYFQWVEDNPLKEEKIAQFQGVFVKGDVSKMRAMTIAGLCNFIDIAHQTWCDWRTNRKDLSEVITRVDSIIYDQKFSGAAADLLNSNIISRDLGLADKTESEIKGQMILVAPQQFKNDKEWEAHNA
mgnify:CR=1 FL=1|tara:strand:- start:2 stop:481 length:480 start_codon:yes stop_codon:yes gene_type:complete